MANNSLITQEQMQSDLEQFYSQKVYPYLNGATHAGFTPVGSVIAIMGNEAPNHYLVCDGTLYTIADYPQLTEFIIDQFGIVNYFGGNGTTTFAVPDLSEEAPTSSSLCIAYENTYIDGSGESSGGGHKIQNEGDLAPLTQRKTLLLNEPIVASDDAEGGNTVVDVDTDVDLSVIQAPGTAGNVEGHIYSTSETVVGKWIDGRNLYEMTIETNAIFPASNANPNYLNYTVNFSDLNIDRIVSSRFVVIGINELNGYHFTDCSTIQLSFIDTVNNRIQISQSQTTGTNRIKMINIILQYIKTTDTV